MKPMMHPDMIEATRLTREGRLTEATALIQRILQSRLEPDASTGEPRAVADAPQIAAGPIIELTPEVIEVRPCRSSPPGRAEADLDASLVGSKVPGTPMPDWLRGLIAKVGRRLDAVAGPPSSDTPAGGRPYWSQGVVGS